MISSSASTGSFQPSRSTRSFHWFLIAALVFAAQVVPRLWTDSAVTDETWETTSGYYYWALGDVSAPHNHPPLADALNALPLTALHLTLCPDHTLDSENRAYVFYYVFNLPKLTEMLICSRLVSLLFFIGTGFLIHLWFRRYGPVVHLSALFLWAFEPNLLAFSVISKADAGFTFFCTASLFCFLYCQEKKGWAMAFLTGALTGMAVTSKLTGLCLLPIYLVLDLYDVLLGGKNLSHRIRPWIWGFLGFGSLVALVYLPGTFRLQDHREPFAYFWDRIRESLWFKDYLHYSFYLNGKYYPDKAWWQLPVVFFLKSTLPFTFLILIGLWEGSLGSKRLPYWAWTFPLLWILCLYVSPLVYLRYALPIYPALICCAAWGVAGLWQRGSSSGRRAFWWAVVTLLFWHAASSLSCFSNQIGYVNDGVPSEAKFHLLDQHYYDLNQDLKRLSALAQERHWSNIRLAYDGQDDPFYYGLPLWEPWSAADLAQPQPGTVYLVKRLMLHAGSPGFPIHESWVSSRNPTGVVGDSWVYYEIPGKRPKEESPLLPSTPYLVYQNAPYRRGN